MHGPKTRWSEVTDAALYAGSKPEQCRGSIGEEEASVDSEHLHSVPQRVDAAVCSTPPPAEFSRSLTSPDSAARRPPRPEDLSVFVIFLSSSTTPSAALHAAILPVSSIFRRSLDAKMMSCRQRGHDNLP